MGLAVSDIVALHDEALRRWEASEPAAAPAAAPVLDQYDSTPLRELVEAQHFANFAIWGLEDEARSREAGTAGDAKVAAIKRAIDPWNQRRNDLMEAVDEALLARYSNVDLSGSELHSETAGMIIDRLSILALKIHAMERLAGAASADGQAARAGHETAVAAEAEVATECRERAALLREQREDLAACLARLLEDFAAGRRHFKRYRQMKTYNHPRLNPVLRGATAAAAGPARTDKQ